MDNAETRQINKVKVKGDNVYIAWQVNAPEGPPEERTLSCPEAPKAGLLRALKSLARQAAEWLEMPDPAAWATNLEVRSVAFGWKQDVMGAVLTVIKPLEFCTGPWIINTPQRPAEPYNKGGEDEEDESHASDCCLTPKCVKLLETLLLEANAYIDGERAQAKLPLGDEAAKAAE